MIANQVRIFLVVGILTVAVDFFVYMAFVISGLVNTEAAKGVGFLVGSIFAYIANKKWTFQYTFSSMKVVMRFMTIYIATLFINIVINSVVLELTAKNLATNYLAFMFATVASAFLNFIGMRFYVFRKIIR